MTTLPSSDRRSTHQLLRLVDSYADEELMRERAIEELRTKRTDLASEFESASAELEKLKETRSAAEEEARRLLVELETLEAALNFKQAKLSSQQQQISTMNTLSKKREDEDMCIRDTFIKTMTEINTTVRKNLQSANNGRPSPLDNQSAHGEPGIAKSSSITMEEGVRHKEVSEQLRKIRAEEARLLTVGTNLKVQQEKLKHSKDKEEVYMESISQATRDLTSTRNQSEDLEKLVASLTTDLQDLYVCPQCGTDNIAQVTG